MLRRNVIDMDNKEHEKIEEKKKIQREKRALKIYGKDAINEFKKYKLEFNGTWKFKLIDGKHIILMDVIEIEKVKTPYVEILNLKMPSVYNVIFHKELNDNIQEYNDFDTLYNSHKFINFVFDEYKNLLKTYYLRLGFNYEDKIIIDELLLSRCNELMNAPDKYVNGIDEIIKDFTDIENTYIFKIENVINLYCLVRFEEKIRLIKKKYGENSYLCKSTTSYHGTSINNIYGIVKNGLLHPKRSTIGIKHGAKYGEGIYTSPNAKYARQYVSDTRVAFTKGDSNETYGILVCAVLMGVSLKGKNFFEKMDESMLDDKYDSYINSDSNEYVVYDESQVLPVYVIHFTTSVHKSKKYYISSHGGSSGQIYGFKLLKEIEDKKTSDMLKREKINSIKEAKLSRFSAYFGNRFSNRHITVAEDDDDDDDETWLKLCDDENEYDDDNKDVLFSHLRHYKGISFD
jgi:hypothetical protein